MTDEELDQEHQFAMNTRDEARIHAAEIQAEKDRRAMEAKLGGLSGSDREALLQMLQAEGIESAEEVGKV